MNVGHLEPTLQTNRIGPFFQCVYEPLCRGGFQVENEKYCSPNGNLRQVVCKGKLLQNISHLASREVKQKQI